VFAPHTAAAACLERSSQHPSPALLLVYRRSSTAHAVAAATGRPQRGALRARLIGVGAAAPAAAVTNQQLEQVVETSDEWIAKRTGIRQRHLLGPGEGLAALASVAAERALEQAGVEASEVELVIMATSTPDDLFGDAACVAQTVGATNAVAFDLTAACSGFLFAVTSASHFLHAGSYRTALVIGADALSRWVDWGDRNTCVLFGDGAGAVVMRAASDDEDGLSSGGGGVLGFEMHSNGAGRPNLNCEYSGEVQQLASVASVTNGEYSPLAMNGKEVYKFATTMVPQVLGEALENAGVAAADVDWLLLHQANIRIMEVVAKKLVRACRRVGGWGGGALIVYQFGWESTRAGPSLTRARPASPTDTPHDSRPCGRASRWIESLRISASMATPRLGRSHWPSTRPCAKERSDQGTP
jgi:3-oxoacyl-[acyl-carrier-protein] synthase-3